MKPTKLLLFPFFLFLAFATFSQPIIIDHNCAFLEPIPEWAIKKASDSLHIAYGHTSHGSQITYGMKALANQTTQLKGYKGDFYCWEEYHEVYGDNPCLDIDDKFRPGDLGHNGDTTWAARTRDYLLHETRAQDINVVMWSWCGGCSDNTDRGIQTYLDAMNKLEEDFPDITFIYMTGHLDHWSDATLKRNNQLIRNYCIANNKILYDFADIESYDPDNNFYEFSNDNCDYYDANGNKLGNWAEEWQSSHTLNVDWYQCSAAHTKPLNGNRKAYAAWWLWARLVGWNPENNGVEITQQPQNDTICSNGTAMFSIDFNNADSIRWQYKEPGYAPFKDIFDNDIFSGATEKTLTIKVENNNIPGNEYICKLYYGDTIVYSNGVFLYIFDPIPALVSYENIDCNGVVIFDGSNPSPGTCKWRVLAGNSELADSTEYETFAYNLSHGKNTFEYITYFNGCSDTMVFDVYHYDKLSITNQDILIDATPGDNISITINVSGDLDSAQWYKDGAILNNGEKYSGVNSPTLLINNIENGDKGYYWCELTGYCNDIFSDSVYVDITNATIDFNSETNIIIYPNPANDILFIKSNTDIKSIGILDINGNKITDINKPGKHIDISTLTLNKGVYLLKIKTAKNIFYSKVMKI